MNALMIYEMAKVKGLINNNLYGEREREREREREGETFFKLFNKGGKT